MTQYEKIANDIRKQILNESYKKDCLIPDQFELANHYQVSRMTIQSTNSNILSHSDTNGNQPDSKLIKTEQLSPNHDTKIQVNKHNFFRRLSMFTQE